MSSSALGSERWLVDDTGTGKRGGKKIGGQSARLLEAIIDLISREATTMSSFDRLAPSFAHVTASRADLTL